MPLIQTRNLTKLYRMGDSIVHALDGVDLNIERGEFVAITGASGSGKSTIMHLLGCLDRPTAGEYFLDDRNVAELTDRELATIRNQRIGFVFQTFNLINRTSAVENVSIPLFYARQSSARKLAIKAIERVGLTQRMTHSPAELSGGERQRVAIARAIVNDPLLVLADEPTGNLDTSTGEQIMEIFRSLNEHGVTIVLVTHEPEVAIQANRIVHMRDGKILSDQLTADIRAEAGESPRAASASPLTPTVAAPSQPDHASASAARLDSETDASSDSSDTPELPPRRAKGATAALVVGLASVVFLIAMIVVAAAGAYAVKRSGFDPEQFTPGQKPPAAIIVTVLLVMVTFLLSMACGITAFIWGRAVIRRTHNIPGNWIGIKRARTGWICGLVTVLIPVCLAAVRFVTWAVRNTGA